MREKPLSGLQWYSIQGRKCIKVLIPVHLFGVTNSLRITSSRRLNLQHLKVSAMEFSRVSVKIP